MLNGTYTLSYVDIWDSFDNNTYYSASGTPGNIDFDTVCFTVEDSPAKEDHTPPNVSTVSMEEPGKIVTVGDKLYFSVSTEDESGISILNSDLIFTYVCEQNHKHNVRAYAPRGENGNYDDAYDSKTKQAKFELEITDTMLNGTYTLSYVDIWDSFDNNTYYSASGTPSNIDFDSICFVIATPDIVPETVSIPGTTTLSVRSTQTIYPTVTPVDSIPDWTWVSENDSIATVVRAESGKACLITGVSPGTITITGTTQNNLTATCIVTVTDAPKPESGTIDASYQVGVGGFKDIIPELTPSGATTLYEVSSDNPHVAGIGLTNGGAGVRIEGNNPGTATITIRGSNNLVMTSTVTVGSPTDRQHEKETIEGRPATCGREGRTDRVVCSVCWYVFTEAEVIPATGEHTYGDWRVLQAATATANGLRERRCETCGKRETQTIPATGSSGGSSGSHLGGGSSSGSNSSNEDDSSSSSPSQSISAGEQKIPVSVSSGTVNVSATDKQIEESIASSKETGVVQVDLTTVKNASEVKLPQKMVSAIQNSEDVSGLSLTTKSGSIEMSGAALNTISTALTGSNDQVSLKVDTVDVSKIPSTQKYPIASVLNTAVFVELSANVIHRDGNGKTTSTESLHKFHGNVTVSIPYEQPANVAGRQIIACHIADDGTITYFPVRYENGVVTFTTTHFSKFAIVESYGAAFHDVDMTAWYATGVEHALSAHLMNGTANSTFNPGGTLTRQQVWMVLARLGGQTPANMAEARALAISSGLSDGTNPTRAISRQQMVATLYRYCVSKGYPVSGNGSLERFSDTDQVSAYAKEAMAWAVGNGIVAGTQDGTLNPTGITTRAQFAVIMQRFSEKIARG